MFRNTLLFAASKLFGEGSPLRDTYTSGSSGFPVNPRLDLRGFGQG
jgi:hypothetical protein